MAGRFVVLEFDDPDSAESFVQNDHIPDQLGFKTLAMYVAPKKFCECPGKHDVKDWFKGKRTGLYLCRKCRKPSIHHKRGIVPRLQYVFGFNLLGD